jgi:general secretion pathway protein G
MNNITIGILLLIGTVAAVTTDIPEQLKTVFEESVAAAQMVSTAGDMHSMSVMLDAKYIMDRRLPTEKDFDTWLAVTFKENNVKDLSVDHWGNKYVYRISNNRRSYSLMSCGPDGILGSADDMVKSGP